MATGLGADVTILDVDLERMRFLDMTMNNADTLYSERSEPARSDAGMRFVDRRGACAGSKGAEINHARNVEKNETGQRAGGYLD